MIILLADYDLMAGFGVDLDVLDDANPVPDVLKLDGILGVDLGRVVNTGGKEKEEGDGVLHFNVGKLPLLCYNNYIMKTCKLCVEEGVVTPQPLTNFYKRSASKDGLSSVCKKHALRAATENRKKYADRVREYNRNYVRNNPDKVREWNHTNRCRNLVARMLKDAEGRAKVRGVPFGLTEEDVFVPETCPVLGIPIKVGRDYARANSPSLDCIVPERGYVPGNIAVISYRANTIKSNATVEEIEAVIAWLKKVLQSEEPSTKG